MASGLRLFVSFRLIADVIELAGCCAWFGACGKLHESRVLDENITMHPPLDLRILPILRKYSAGDISAYDAACEIQDLGLPGLDDPSAGDVVAWIREAGLSLPAPSLEEAEAEARDILARMRRE
jgi:hypothetical protein